MVLVVCISVYSIFIFFAIMCFLLDPKRSDSSIVCVLQRPEDEEMLVPHSDLAENNHQPMDGIVLLPFVLFDP